MKTRAVRDGDHWVLNLGAKRWITNAGVSEFYTVMAVTDPSEALQGHLRLRRREVRRGRLLFGAPEKKLGHQGLPRPREVYLDPNVPASPPTAMECAGCGRVLYKGPWKTGAGLLRTRHKFPGSRFGIR
ncbi:hypothetical protein SGLAM104S_09559 [Streptomyces glaucescens]